MSPVLALSGKLHLIRRRDQVSDELFQIGHQRRSHLTQIGHRFSYQDY
jgi:hypothetical protein